VRSPLALVLLAAGCHQAATALPPDAGTDGKQLFAMTCAKCHGDDGRGQTAQGRLLGARDLTRAEVRRLSDEQIAHQVRVGGGKMPAFSDLFSDEQLRSIVAHVRNLP
jgi:mono/diheme cytochrome c family protein